VNIKIIDVYVGAENQRFRSFMPGSNSDLLRSVLLV